MATIQGYYRWVWQYVPNLEDRYAYSPFYGRRRRYINSYFGVVTQILIVCMGDMVWVNMADADLFLTPPSGALKGAA